MYDYTNNFGNKQLVSQTEVIVASKKKKKNHQHMNPVQVNEAV